jgi:hypothetical protein
MSDDHKHRRQGMTDAEAQAKKMMLRSMVRGAYDLQKLRIQTGLRIVGNFKVKLGQEPGKKETELGGDAKKMIEMLRLLYETITEGVVDLPKGEDFVGKGVISEYTELCLIHQYLSLLKHEKAQFARFGDVLVEFPIWTEWLKDIKGVGVTMAAVIVTEIDIHKAAWPSSIFRLAGLDCGPDGMGRSKRKEHLVKVKYLTKDGKESERDSITFNPFLKSKLLGVLASSFLRAKSPYAEVYYGYKHRMENHAKYGPHNDKVKDENGKRITNPGRRHEMSRRYMIKMFIYDLHENWRRLAGLPPVKTYPEDKLGRPHGARGLEQAVA